MPLTRDDILNAPDIQKELVSVPGWGGEVWVKAISGTELSHFQSSMLVYHGQSTRANLENIHAKLVSLACVDENGQRLFTEKDIPALGKKSAECLNLVFTVAQRLAGLSNEAVDELAEGLEKDPFEDSPSD